MQPNQHVWRFSRAILATSRLAGQTYQEGRLYYIFAKPELQPSAGPGK